MAREHGTFVFGANLEITTTAPLDARTLVSTFDELLLEETWKTNNKIWLYNNIVVAVADVNGIYMLTNYDLGTAPDAYKNKDNWKRLDGGAEISALEQKVAELESKQCKIIDLDALLAGK